MIGKVPSFDNGHEKEVEKRPRVELPRAAFADPCSKVALLNHSLTLLAYPSDCPLVAIIAILLPSQLSQRRVNRVSTH